MKDFLADHREVTAIATCRRKRNGGNFDGALTTELDMLAKAAQSGCQIVDLEVESAEEAKPAQLARLRAAGAALLISFHDFTRTRSLEQAADRIEAFKPDFVKVVSTARTLADNLAVLRLIEDRSIASHVIGIAMGKRDSSAAYWVQGPARRLPLPPFQTGQKPHPDRSPPAPCTTFTALSILTRRPASSEWPATQSPTRCRL